MRTALVTILLLAGCQTTRVTSDGRPMPGKPVAAPKAPATARVNAMAVRVGSKARDTDGNGFPDEVVVEAHLFSKPYPSPMHEDGAFVFRLYLAGVSNSEERPPLVEWRIEGEALARTRIQSQFGPGHVFRLSLLDTGGDQYPSLSTVLTCWFDPSGGGEQIRSSDAYPIKIGRGDGRGS